MFDFASMEASCMRASDVDLLSLKKRQKSG
jgi:hypothetical protein